MKALALVDSPDHVCCRYRVRAFGPALAESGWSLEVEGLAAKPYARLLQCRRAAHFDAVLLQRKLLPSWQLWDLRRHAKRLIFDFDDAVPHRDSYDPRGPHSRRREARFARTVRLADAVIAGNDFLASLAAGAGAKAGSVRVIPTCVDPTHYTPKPPGRREAGLELVWVGSSSTLQGLELRRDLWETLAREIPGLRLRLIGDRFPDFGPLSVVEVPWSEATEASEIASADVGISWVPDDLWSRGKCGLKILQYQAAGLPVVTNPVGVHPKLVAPGVTGFLPRTDGAWAEAIRRLAAQPALRERMGRAARASVEAGYSVRTWAPAVVAAFSGSEPAPRPHLLVLRPEPVIRPISAAEAASSRP